MTDGEFKRLILPNYSSMYVAAFIILRNKTDACDAVQETMARLWERRAKLEITVSPQALCNTATRNCSIDMLRRHHGELSTDSEPLSVHNDVPSAIRADSEANCNSLIEAIGKTLDTFNGAHRRVLSLSFISRLNNEEIAQATGLSPDNIRQILSRGRRKLKEIMSHEIDY